MIEKDRSEKKFLIQTNRNFKRSLKLLDINGQIYWVGVQSENLVKLNDRSLKLFD